MLGQRVASMRRRRSSIASCGTSTRNGRTSVLSTIVTGSIESVLHSPSLFLPCPQRRNRKPRVLPRRTAPAAQRHDDEQAHALRPDGVRALHRSPGHGLASVVTGRDGHVTARSSIRRTSFAPFASVRSLMLHVGTWSLRVGAGSNDARDPRQDRKHVRVSCWGDSGLEATACPCGAGRLPAVPGHLALRASRSRRSARRHTLAAVSEDQRRRASDLPSQG